MCSPLISPVLFQLWSTLPASGQSQSNPNQHLSPLARQSPGEAGPVVRTVVRRPAKKVRHLERHPEGHLERHHHSCHFLYRHHPSLGFKLASDCRRDLRDGKGFSWVHWVRGPALSLPAPPVCLARCAPRSAGGGETSEGSSAPCAPSLPASPCGWLLLYL